MKNFQQRFIICLIAAFSGSLNIRGQTYEPYPQNYGTYPQNYGAYPQSSQGSSLPIPSVDPIVKQVVNTGIFTGSAVVEGFLQGNDNY